MDYLQDDINLSFTTEDFNLDEFSKLQKLHFKNPEIVPAIERMMYATFRRQYVIYRLGDLSSKPIDMSTQSIELPTNSVLHMVDRLLDTSDADIAPDVTIPLISDETFPVYVAFATKIPAKDDPLFPVTDKYRFIPSAIAPKAMRFYAGTKQVRRPTNVSDVIARPNALTVMSYNHLKSLYITGRMIKLRQFDILLRTILKNVSDYSGKHHHIYIPVSDKIYSRLQYERAYKVLNTSTIRIYDDMSYYFLIHLFAYLSDGPVSLFNKLSEESLASTNIILANGSNCVIYNLKELKELGEGTSYVNKVMRQVNMLKMIEDPKLNNEDVEINDDLIDTVSSKKIEVDQDPSMDVAEDVIVDSDNVDTEVVDVSDDKMDNLTKSNIKKVVEIPDAEKTSHKDSIKEKLNHLIDKSETPMSEPQKEFIQDISNFESIKLNGKSINDLITDTSEPKIDSKIEVLDDFLVDKSMTQSSIMEFNNYYITHMLDRHIAQVLTGFTGNGMIVSKINTDKVVNAFDRYQKYTVTFTDMTGKQHTVSFKLPLISTDGTMLINGIESRMVSQIVNIPICKVSPTRVSLVSNFNKTMVERLETVARRYDIYINKYLDLLVRSGAIDAKAGRHDESTIKLPYEYNAIAGKFNELSFKGWTLIFNYENRFEGFKPEVVESLKQHESDIGGVYLGRDAAKNWIFFGYDNVIYIKDKSGKTIETSHLVSIFANVLGDVYKPPKMPEEWTEVKIRDKNFPVVFVLGYRYGLSSVLNKLKHKWKFIPKGAKSEITITDVQVPFANGVLVFNRYPLEKSMILSGLLKFKTQNYTFEEYDLPDTYFTTLSDAGWSTNHLKGITGHFDYFVDPITKHTLIKMGEPTTFAGLLIRATEMLSYASYYQQSSTKHHRIRGYERFADVLYNEMARSMEAYENQRHFNKRSFSMNPEAVFQRIMQDPTTQIVDTINPMHDLKSRTAVTYAGSGGRTARSFVTADRIFPKDGIGILSEATPDSSKVAINAFTSVDPSIKDLSGLFDTDKATDQLEPSNVFSTSAIIMPFSSNDDPKRVSFINNQLTHHVPCRNSEISRVRTGFDAVVAHRTSRVFAHAAKRDGVVEFIDYDAKVIRIKYDTKPLKHDLKMSVPLGDVALQNLIRDKNTLDVVRAKSDIKDVKIGSIIKVNDKHMYEVVEILTFAAVEDVPNYSKLTTSERNALRNKTPISLVRMKEANEVKREDLDAIQFGQIFTSVSGSYVGQTVVPNVQPGDKIKKGDIVAYNDGFFKPLPNSKQVAWMHGIPAKVAYIDISETYEDSCSMSKAFADRLSTITAHARTLVFTNTTKLDNVVNIGDQLETTDPLCYVEEGDIDVLSETDDPEITAFLGDLSRSTPKAKYHGTVADIRIYYACSPQELHPSLLAIAKKVAKKQLKIARAVENTVSEAEFPTTQYVAPGTSYKSIKFEKDTVILEIIISEEIGCEVGDKVVVGSANKSIIGDIMEEGISTESGYPIDIKFGGTSISNRIVLGAIKMSHLHRCMTKTEQDILSIWFDEE